MMHESLSWSASQVALNRNMNQSNRSPRMAQMPQTYATSQSIGSSDRTVMDVL